MYKRVFRNTVIICLIYSILLSICIIYPLSRLAKRDIVTYLEGSTAYFEREFKALSIKNKITAEYILSNEHIGQYVNNSDVIAKHKLQQELRWFADFESPTISRIAFYVDGNSDMYCSNETMTLNYYAEQIGAENGALFEMMDKLKQNGLRESFDYLLHGNKLTMISCSRGTYRIPVYVLVTFDMSDIFKTIESSGIDIFIYKNDTPVYEMNPGHSEAAMSLLRSGESSDYPGKVIAVQAFNDDISTKAVFLCTRASHFGSQIKIVASGVIFFLLILGISLFGIKRVLDKVYNPIKSLIKDIKNMPDTIEDEYETIHGYIGELEKKNATMSEYLTRTNEDRCIFAMLSGEAERESVEQFISLHRLEGIAMGAAIIEFRQYESYYSEFTDENVAVIKRIILELLNDRLSDCIFHHTMSFAANGLVVVYSAEHGGLEELFAEIVGISDSKFSIKLNVCIGDIYASPHELYKSYTDARYISKSISLKTEEGAVFTKKDILNINNSFVYPIDVEKNLISAALSGDKKTLRETVHFIMEVNSSSMNVSDECIIQITVLLSATIQKIMSECELETEELFGEGWNTYLELRQSKTFDELERRAVEILERITDAAEQSDSDSFRNIKTSIEKYIEEHYHEDISLSTLSAYLNLSESYVSKLFKSVMGVNFKEYVMHYKYIKAKKIMRDNPTYKLKDVAEMVGCNTPLTLSRLLKKYDKGGR